MRERNRHRRWAATRAWTDEEEFVGQMAAAGIADELARWLHVELLPYYFRPLTPYSTDRVYADPKIDSDDLSDIAVQIERHFGVRLEGNPIPCPSDPSIAELAIALDWAARY